MAEHVIHRGWLNTKNNGILAAVYNGAQEGTTALTANTALDGVLAGTPVMLIIPVDSLVFSNNVANGDIVFATLLGGTNSTEVMRIDTSAGALLINDGSVDLDVRMETDGLAYAFYLDGAKNAIVLGSNTDTSVADQLLTISRAARTATAATNFFDVALAPAGAVTIPAGTTAVVAEMSIAEPNITATGTVTNATTLYIPSQPTEGGTTNSSIFFGAAANIAATVSLTFNDDSADVDFRFEGDNNANMLVLDAGTDSAAIGRAVIPGAFLAIDGSAVNRAGVTAVGRAVHLPAATYTQTNGAPTTLAVGAHVYIGAATMVGANINQTITDMAAVAIDLPVAGTNVTLTRTWGIYAAGAGNTAHFGGGVNIGAPTSTNNLIAAASTGAGTATMYIGNASINVTSDVRVKTNIMEWQGNALDLLRRAEPLKEFTYNMPGGGPQDSGYGPNARGRYLGFMAQETRKWAPWVVNAGAGADCQKCLAGEACEKHSPWTVEYQHLVPLMVAGLKELDARLSAAGI